MASGSAMLSALPGDVALSKLSRPEPAVRPTRSVRERSGTSGRGCAAPGRGEEGASDAGSGSPASTSGAEGPVSGPSSRTLSGSGILGAASVVAGPAAWSSKPVFRSDLRTADASPSWVAPPAAAGRDATDPPASARICISSPRASSIAEPPPRHTGADSIGLSPVSRERSAMSATGSRPLRAHHGSADSSGDPVVSISTGGPEGCTGCARGKGRESAPPFASASLTAGFAARGSTSIAESPDPSRPSATRAAASLRSRPATAAGRTGIDHVTRATIGLDASFPSISPSRSTAARNAPSAVTGAGVAPSAVRGAIGARTSTVCIDTTTFCRISRVYPAKRLPILYPRHGSLRKIRLNRRPRWTSRRSLPPPRRATTS